MEEKRTAIAVLLCILVVTIYTQLVFEQPPQPVPAQQTQAQSGQQTAQTPGTTIPTGQHNVPANAAAPGIAPTSQTRPTAGDLTKSARTTVASNLMTISIVHLGARIESFKLAKYTKTLDAVEPLDMVVSRENAPLPLGLVAGGISDENVPYTLKSTTGSAQKIGSTFTITEGTDFSLVFEGTLPTGTVATKTLTFHPDSYLFEVDVKLSGTSGDGSAIWLEWTHVIPKDTDEKIEKNVFIQLGNDDNKLKTTPVAGVDKPVIELGSNLWVSLANKYFMSTLIPDIKGSNTRVGREGDDVYFSQARGEQTSGRFSIYCGPKDDRILSQIGFQLHRNIDLGMFSFLAYPLLQLIRIFYHFIGNFGLAIIALTLMIKLLFFPLNRASLNSMKKMQDIQPEMKALRERIKDPNQLNQEMMALYKRSGVNPMGGCLPILVQLPVFLGLYNALLNSIELRHAPFALWIKDLSAPEYLHLGSMSIPVMVLIMGLSMFVQQWTTPTAADPTQKKVMMFMPIFFTWIFIQGQFPAGLVLYWLVNNIISIIQQMYLRSETHANPLRATALASLGIFALGYLLTLI